MCAEDKNACCVLLNSFIQYHQNVHSQIFHIHMLKLQKKNCAPGIAEFYEIIKLLEMFLEVISKVTIDILEKDLVNVFLYLHA